MRWGNRVIPVVALTLLIGLALPAGATAAAGDLDPSFGTGGVSVISRASIQDFGQALAVQPDGKIVVVGFTRTGGGTLDFVVARLSADGSPDAGFGSAGFRTIDLGGSDEAKAVAIQPDGKIVVAGSSSPPASFADFAVVRLNADGSNDTAFDNPFDAAPAGAVVIGLGGNDRAEGLVLQPDGKIVVAGPSVDTTTGSSDFGVMRLDADGDLDTGFDNPADSTPPGASVVSLGADDKPDAVALQPDGKLLLAGRSTSVAGQDVAILRLNADASFDPSFSSNSFEIFDLGGDEVAGDVAIQPDGKIVIGGHHNPPTLSDSDFMVMRLAANGAIDPNFGPSGFALIDVGVGESGDSVAIQADGKIVIAGNGRPTTPGALDDFAAARVNADGSTDPTFGSNGERVIDLGGTDYPEAMTLQPDGKVLIAGTMRPSGPGLVQDHFAVVRLLADPGPNPGPDPDPVPNPSDTDPPETEITKGPPKKVETDKRKATVRFRFNSDEAGSGFECKIDKMPFVVCDDPGREKLKAKLGKHKFQVRAIDAAGNVDPTPARQRFKVL